MIKRKLSLLKNILISNNNIKIFGRNIQDNFSLQLNKNQIKYGVNVNFHNIISILYVKPSFTKGILEIFYENNYSQKVWFQIRLSKSWWVAADLIVKHVKNNYKKIKIIQYISTKEWKDREARAYLNKRKNKR